MEINGMAHLVLSVNDMKRSLPFYQRLFDFLEFKTVYSNEKGAYFVGGKTAIGIMAAAPEFRNERFEQSRVGMHHFCLRARTREDVDTVYEFLVKMGAKIIRPAEEGPWGPGYYSVLFEDPDGIRLEVNFVPGKGLLESGTKFNPSGY